ncbi:MAG: hypothetical protein KC900_03680 [Candidatus Omnitrophica bacterium]|nr:hypothetical protein [Candidatus Omnitrophota bacterium]
MKIAAFKRSFICQMTSFIVLSVFLTTSVVPPAAAQTVAGSVLDLPVPGTLVEPTGQFDPAIIKGITIHPDDPLQMSFLVDQGETAMAEADFRTESSRMIKYFLAALTVPENELWVNLSPYEENRIVGNHLGVTEMGRDLLAQDYLLKQLTSSMMYPEGTTGQEFWSRVHKLAYERFGTTEVPMNTFNKIWIVPEKAVIYEHANRAVIIESKLKVMLEEDYLALENHQAFDKHGQTVAEADVVTGAAADVVREVLIPEIEREINHGRTFSQLRQVYHAVILADWYKENLKESLMGKAYVGQNKTAGIETADRQVNQKIYEQYVESFKKGVYNYIKEDVDPVTGDSIPRHYFSGGADFTDNAVIVEEGLTPAQVRLLDTAGIREVDVSFDFARPDSALIAEDLDKKRGVIRLGDTDATEGLFFNVKRWISRAAEKGRVSTFNPVPNIKSLLSKTRVIEVLDAAGVDADKLYDMVDEVTFLAVDDIKNGSPVILLRNAASYRVASSNVGENSISVGAGLVNQLMGSDQENMLDYLLIRELVGLYKAAEIKADESIEDVGAALAQAEAQAEEVEQKLVGDQLTELIQASVDNFLDDYYEKLLTQNVVWDYESSVLDEIRGKELVGGKTFQQGLYWSQDPEGNLRSFGGTTTASTKFLKAHADLIPQINAILDDLDVANDQGRVKAERDIRALIVSYDIPEDIARDVAEAYRKQVEITGQELVAVRSSGKAEDASIVFKVLTDVVVGSNAGQHDSYLGEAGEADVVRRWRDDVSSLYTEQVLKYRDTLMVITAMDDILSRTKKSDQIIEKLSASKNRDDLLVAEALRDKNFNIITSVKLREALRRNGFVEMVDVVEARRSFYFDVENIAMGVTIMPMADVVTSFVIMGHDIGSNWTGFTFQNVPEAEYLNKGRVATMTFTWRLGESIVQGVTTPDTFLVHIVPGENGEEAQVNILSKQLGTKTVQAIYAVEAFRALGMTESDLAPYLRLAEGEEVSGPLFKAKAGASIEDIQETIQRLVKLKVDATAAEITDADLDLFDLDKDQLKLLVHLVKEKSEDPEIKTMFTDVPEFMREIYSVTDSQVIDVAREYMKKAEGYGHLVDMEGGIGLNLGRPNTPITVQRRSSNVLADVKEPDLIRISYTYVKEKDLKEAKGVEEVVVNDQGEATELRKGQLVAQGIPTRNSFTGVIYRVDETKELTDQFEEIKALAGSGKKIIIRTRETTPDYNAVLQTKNVYGVIADVGGATSHAAVMSRELGIATVVGIQTFVNKLEGELGPEEARRIIDYINTSGNVVTVDANANEKTGYGMVYAGELPISERNIEIQLDRLPEIYTKIGYIMGMPHPMLQMSKIARYNGFSGVALMRGEFAYAEENVNPRFGRAYDNLLVLDYLRAQENPAYRDELSDEERTALVRFEKHFGARNKLREQGVVVAADDTESKIENFSEVGSEAFLKSLGRFERRDVDLIRSHTDDIAAATRQMIGYMSYNDFFEAVHGGAISTMAAANNQDVNAVLYRSIDFKKNEAAELIGSRVFDPEPEVSTMIGERGARWLLQPENEIILREEIKMLLRQVAKGYRNIGFFFPFVSTPNELNRLTEILNEEERQMSESLGKPVFLREVGQMTELPSNVIQADEFIAVLKKHEAEQLSWFQGRFGEDVAFKRKSFLSFGTNDLTQLTLGADRDNPMMAYLFNEAHPFVTDSIRHVAAAAVDASTKCGLCGQALVNLVNINPEAAEAILMILGQTGGYAGTDYLGTVAAVIRSASATLKHGVVVADEGEDLEQEALVQGFRSSLDRGAATRPLYVIKSAADLDATYVGDYVALMNGIDVEIEIKEEEGKPTDYTIVDESLREKFSRLGAVIVPEVEGFVGRADLVNALRQLGIPVIQTLIRNVRAIDETLEQGQRVTIDFNRQIVYRGEKETRVNVPELVSSLAISEEAVSTPTIGFESTFSASKFYKARGVHPLTYVTTTTQSRSELRAALKKAILEAFGTDKSKSLVYETLDLDTHDLVRLRGHEKFLDEAEVNPALGFAGVDALVKDDQWRNLLKLEMEVVAGLISEGYNISVQFNSAKIPESVEQAIAIALEAGVPQGTSFGINTAWPGNYLALGQYISHGLDFVTLNERRLAQGYLSADLYKNPSVMRFYKADKVLPSLKRPVAMITRAVAEAGIALRKIGFDEDAAVLAEGQSVPSPTKVIYTLLETVGEEDGDTIVEIFEPLDVKYSFDRVALEANRELIQNVGEILFEAALRSGRVWRHSIGIPYRVLVGLPEYDLDEDDVLFILAAGHALGLWILGPHESEGRYSRDQVAAMYRLDRGATYPVVKFRPGTELAAHFMADAAMSAEVDSFMAVRIKDRARQAVSLVNGGDRDMVRARLAEAFEAGLQRWGKDKEQAKAALVEAVNAFFVSQYGIKAFASDTDEVEFNNGTISWMGMPIADKKMLGFRVRKVEDDLIDLVATRIELRFGLDGKVMPDGIREVTETAVRLVQGNQNPAKKLAFARELGEAFKEEAQKAGANFDDFADGIVSRMNALRPGMLIFEPGKVVPRLYGSRLVTWLNRVIAIKTDSGFEILEDELVFFAESLTGFLNARYTQADEFLSTETQIINGILAQPQFVQLKDDHTQLVKLSMAAAMTNGLEPKPENPNVVFAWGRLTGALIGEDFPVSQKLNILEDIYIEVLRRNPRIDPVQFVLGLATKGVGEKGPDVFHQIYRRLQGYLTLLRSGELNGTDDVNKVIAAVERVIADEAVIVEAGKEVGGIDLDPNLFELQRKGDGSLIFPKFNGAVERLNLNGFVPVIINVTPVSSLPMLLGMIENAEDESNGISYDSLDPLDRNAKSLSDQTDQLSLLAN